MESLKEFIWQKVSWVNLLTFFVGNMFKSFLKWTYFFQLGEIEKAIYWKHEMIEAFYWSKIHITYKSKRIK